MNKNVLFLIFLSVLASLNLASIRKAEDPIRDTQTNPILYEQKKEEEKDGKKGPLLYHVKNYPRESFFIDPPFEKETKSAAKGTAYEAASIPMDTAGWWEEEPAGFEAAVPSDEDFSEASQEALPEKRSTWAPEESEPAIAEADAGNEPNGQGEDYWW